MKVCGIDRVLTRDLHSNQIQAFFEPNTQCDQLRAANILCKNIKQNFDLDNYILVAPDPGAVKMVQRYQDILNLDLAIIDKRRRDNKDNPIATNVVGEVKDKNCLIIDDEVSSGETLKEAANLLKENGANKVISACVHPVLGIYAPEKIPKSSIDQLITTNTTPTQGKKFDSLSIVSVADMFAQATERIHEGRSVSSIFK